MIDADVLYRAAGISAGVALLALIVAAVTIGLFFAGAGELYGHINDVFCAIALVALLLPIVAVDRLAADAAPWLRVVTIAAIAGALLGAVGQVLLVVGVIDLRTSFVTGGVGIVPVFVWLVALIVLALPMGVLPAAVGWLAAAALALIVVGSAISVVSTGPASWVAWTAVVGALALWLGNLATTLLGRAVA